MSINESEERAQAILLVLCGLPATGKSYFVNVHSELFIEGDEVCLQFPTRSSITAFWNAQVAK